MTLSTVLRRASAIWLAAIPCGTAEGQSIRTPMGAEARATINISVSVLPKFNITDAMDAFDVTSNASSQLRYHVITQSLQQSGSASGSPSVSAFGADHRLVLVVPD